MYLNAKRREEVIVMSAFNDFLEKINCPEVKKYIRTMRTYISKFILPEMLKDIDEYQAAGILRHAESVEFVLQPKRGVTRDENLFVASADLLARLIDSNKFMCLDCEKQGKEIKRCQLRKDFSELGIPIEDSSRPCPYKWE